MSRVSFSNINITSEYAVDWNSDVYVAFTGGFDVQNDPILNNKYSGMTQREFDDIKERHLLELDYSASLKILAAIEASFRIDYLQRVYARKKDDLSREFRKLHRQKGPRVNLESDVLDAWKTHTNSSLFSELKGAFKFRHWLAHGRYWTPKLGQKYDSFGLSVLAQTVNDSVPLIK